MNIQIVRGNGYIGRWVGFKNMGPYPSTGKYKGRIYKRWWCLGFFEIRWWGYDKEILTELKKRDQVIACCPDCRHDGDWTVEK